MKLVLLGFMGSGKTYFGKKLAEKERLLFFDLDELIISKAEKSISQIFEQGGELLFRELEAKALKNFLENNNDFVLSLGGGAPCFSDNITLLKQYQCKTIYLETEAEILAERLKKEKHQRPLIAHLKADELLTYIKEKLKEREVFYLQADEILKL